MRESPWWQESDNWSLEKCAEHCSSFLKSKFVMSLPSTLQQDLLSERQGVPNGNIESTESITIFYSVKLVYISSMNLSLILLYIVTGSCPQ